MIVLLFGPPGSGKGTQADALVQALRVPHVATGDIFRKHLKEGTELGKLARSYMDRGELVPDSVTCALVASRLSEPDAAGGALLDGFPRSVAQAEWLLGWLKERGAKIDAVVNLVVPEEAIVARLSSRRSCSVCGTPAAPGAQGACSKCGGALVQRSDDREEVIRSRLGVYARETAPVLSVLRSAAPVHDVEGLGAVPEIRARIFRALSLPSA
jgi:adenylate kinase